tara:strand:+ start:138 stop:413 length:276 start_codon:yes stop_codon:yes gene_type:complete
METQPLTERQKTYNAYHQEYYHKNKNILNHYRLAMYHEKKNGIPTEYIDKYLNCRSVYNLIKKNRDKLNLELIFYLLNAETEESGNSADSE